MALQSGSLRRTGPWYLCAGVGIFASALVYYVVFRSQLPWPIHLFDLEWVRLSQLNDYSNGSYPSFAFALSMGLIAVGLFSTQRSSTVKAILGIWAVGLLHEICISIFTLTDVLAGTLGAVVALCIGVIATIKSLHPVSSSSSDMPAAAKQTVSFLPTISDRSKLTLLLLSSIAFATGTSPYRETSTSHCLESDVNGTCISTSTQGTPVYMSYAELRSAVKIVESRTLTSVQRINLYGSYLFANELNTGVHIIDNSNPASPKRLGFIEIPGNLDIAIRDGALYADSYIDLVTIDISDIENIFEVSRVEGVFPYNSRQNIPDDVELIGEIDKSLGVVVGYR